MADFAIPPIAETRVKQIVDDVCGTVLESAEYYDHSKVADWNSTIVNSTLKALIAEATPQDAPGPGCKFACNSVIVQHLVPTSALNKPRGGTDAKAAESNFTTSGRRGMHSAVGAYWNDTKDGMWVHRYTGGERKGLDVIVTMLWIAL
ncbi:dynein light chain [Emericellopsis cladophorae]|uniref:Dynein light chain n=1 Tax=Emericellopsis cladophorae TaxID=2686198 RepID=A0A9Q0BH80_9HYPO|nr:dynein light chain [Emericellopsis cladophorae]KAI6784460.1 dynein light chain [Emericellopsis cladophorae]